MFFQWRAAKLQGEQGSLNVTHFGGDQTMQMSIHFEGFSLRRPKDSYTIVIAVPLEQ